MLLPFSIRELIDSFTIYHYAFSVLVLLLSLLFLALGIILRKKRFVALLLYLLSTLLLLVAPFAGIYYLEEYLRKSELKDVKVLRLTYTKAIVLTAKLQNSGAAKIKKTKIIVSLVKKNSNSVLELFSYLNTPYRQLFKIREELAPGGVSDVRLVVDTSKLKLPSSYVLYYSIKSF